MKTIKLSVQVNDPDTGELITIQRTMTSFLYENSRSPREHVSMIVFDMLEAAFAAGRELE